MAGERKLVFREIVRLGSEANNTDNKVRLAKIIAALNILSSAMTIVESEPSKAIRLLTLAKSVSK